MKVDPLAVAKVLMLVAAKVLMTVVVMVDCVFGNKKGVRVVLVTKCDD